MMLSLRISLLFVIAVIPIRGSAAPASDPQCEWANCNEETPANTKQPESLPTCTSRDKYDCGEKCVGLFDEDYRVCLSGCLKGKCSEAKKPEELDPTERDERRDAGALCIETETATCQAECAGQPQTDITRCRKVCFEKRCPDASKIDTAKEAVDPGSVACDRCQKEFEKSCFRQCKLGSYGAPKDLKEGFGRYGCEKLCVMASCSQSCGTRLPW